MKFQKLERNFSPREWRRPSYLKFVNNFIGFGDSGVGKTTLFYHGLHELAEAGVYRREDLNRLADPGSTQNFTRFSIERRKLGFWDIDSWIDGEGEKYQQLCRELNAGAGDSAKKKKSDELDHTRKAVEKCSANMTLVIPASSFMGGSRILKSEIDAIGGVVDHVLRPTGLLRRQKKCTLLISQATDSLSPGGKKLPEEFTKNIRTLFKKTDLGHYCKHALVVDSLADDRFDVCRLRADGRRLALREESSRMCSAGTAMAWIMGLLPAKEAANWGFSISASDPQL